MTKLCEKTRLGLWPTMLVLVGVCAWGWGAGAAVSREEFGSTRADGCLHPADLDGDCCVGLSDVGMLADLWLSAGENLRGDLYEDERIDSKDYSRLSDQWQRRFNRWYVSPSGFSSGDGSQENPWDLGTALGDEAPIRPGDTVWLAGGTYYGPFAKSRKLSGTAESPIIYRAKPGERVTITADASVRTVLSNEAAYVWFWGLEVTADDDPGAIGAGGTAVNQIAAMGCKYINVIVHDCDRRNGFGIWGIGTELCGCVSYRNGQYGYGHGFYCQNRPRDVGGSTDDLPWMKFIDCVAFDNYKWGVHNYGENPVLANMLYDGVVVYANRERNFDSGGRQRDDNLVMRNSFTYHPEGWPSAQFGYHSQSNGRLLMEDNVFVAGSGSLAFNNWEQVISRRNICYTPVGGLLRIQTPDQMFGYEINDNRYYHDQGCYMLMDGIWRHTLEEWRMATGWDLTSTFTPGKPVDAWVFLRPNKYEPGRAHLIVYNWPGNATASIDLGSLWDIQVGQRYRILHLDDIWGQPVVHGMFDGSPIDLAIDGICGPEFACYLVLWSDR